MTGIFYKTTRHSNLPTKGLPYSSYAKRFGLNLTKLKPNIFSPQSAIFNDETIRSSKPQRESPVLIRNDPIDIPVKK